MSYQNDLATCKKYIAKSDSAKARGIKFTLTFNEYKALYRRKRCAYTGLPFSNTNQCNRTLERIDSTKGYTKENTIPVTLFANQFKAVWENKDNPMDLVRVTKFIAKVNKLTKD